MSDLSADNFWLQLAMGNLPGMRRIVVTGVNPDVDTGTPEDLIPWGGNYAFQTAAVALEVVSTSALDAAAGTGLRTVQVTTLSGAFAEVVTNVTLNGLTAVAIPGTHRRVNKLLGLTVGSTGANQGTVTVRVVAGAVPQQQMLPLEGVGRACVYTIPANKYGNLMAASMEIQKTTSDYVQVAIFSRELSVPGPTILEREYLLLSQGPFLDPVLRANRLLGPRDVWLRVPDIGTNNSRVSGRIFIVEENA